MKKYIYLALFLLANGAFAAEPEAPKALSKDQAVARAEAFVKENAGKGSLEALQPKAVGARLDSEMWFVGFKPVAPGGRLRGIMVAQDGSLTKAVSQSMQEDWLAGNDPPPRKPVGRAEAGEIALKFFTEAGGVAPKGEPSNIEDRKDEKADPWDSWWAVFEKASLKGKKGKATVIVAVNKATGEAKWVELKAPKAPPAPKTPAKKKAPKR